MLSRFTPRILLRQPWFASAGIGVIAIGIALATTAASLINALIYRPLPVQAPHELYRVDSGIYDGAASPPHSREVIERLAPIQAFSYAYSSNVEFDRGAGTVSDLIQICELQGDAFGVLGWHPELGRLLGPADTLPGSEPVAVLAHDLWQNQLGADPDVLDTTLRLNGVVYRVVGVLGPVFDRVNRLNSAVIFTAYVHTSVLWKYENSNYQDQTIVARIADASSLPAVQTTIDVLDEELRIKHPDADYAGGFSLKSESVSTMEELGDLAGKSRMIIWLIAALLIVACFNVGNMLLANAYRREREFAIRQSFGATPRHIISLMVRESMTIAAIGGMVGAAVGAGLTHLMNRLDFGTDVNVEFDLPVLAIALILTLSMGILSGLMPALRMSFLSFGQLLKSGARGSATTRFSQILVVGQVAFCATLLTCCFLFFQSLRASLDFDPGIETEKLIYFDTYMSTVADDRRGPVSVALLDRLRAIPGIEYAGMVSTRPLRGAGSSQIRTERFDPTQEADHCYAEFLSATRDYVDVIGRPLLAGRDLRDDEYARPPQVTIINEAMIRRFWPESTPHEMIGRSFIPWAGAELRIVGVVGDFSTRAWEPARPLMINPVTHPRMTVHVRTKSDPRTVMAALESFRRDPSNEFVTGPLELFSDAQARAFVDIDSTLRVIAALGIAALILSACGTWFMTRQLVRLSRKEMCIRLALGAQPKGLLWSTVRRTTGLSALGLGIGAIFSYWLVNSIGPSLPGTEGKIWIAYAVVTAVTGIVALVAGYLPARSILKLQPREILNEV